MSQRTPRTLVLVLVLSLFLIGCQKAGSAAPAVMQTNPQDGATSVARNVAITVSFSDPMDTASAQQAFNIIPAVSGTFSWNNDSVMVFHHDTEFDVDTSYTVTVAKSARDQDGNSLEADCAFSFTTGTGSAGGNRNVYMMGRSVMYGWFTHWGWEWDDETPVVREGFNLYHRNIEGPDDGAQVMINSVREVVESVPASQNPVMFFKLCFIDFYGGSTEEADGNLNKNKEIVGAVYDIVVEEYGYSLILGNALPRMASETDQYLRTNHQSYNQYLQSLQSQHPGEVFILDMYSALSDASTGGIKAQYASASDDAHPNDSGYNALDTLFFSFLKGKF